MRDQIYDNPVIKVNGYGKERVALALSIHSEATGWAVRDNLLAFFWTDPNKDRQMDGTSNYDS